MAELEVRKGFQVFFIKRNVEHFEQDADPTVGEDDHKIQGNNIDIDKTLLVHVLQNAYPDQEFSNRE